jgi:hypothetical protein
MIAYATSDEISIVVMSYVETSSDIVPVIVVISNMDMSSDVAHVIVVTSYMDTLSDVAHAIMHVLHHMTYPHMMSPQ